MPDAGFTPSSCEESQTETLISAGDKDPQTINTKIDSNGATKLYLIRDVRQVDPTTDPTYSNINNTLTSPDNSHDQDPSTAGSISAITSGQNYQGRWDFGSLQSSKGIGVLMLSTIVGGTHTVQVRHSENASDWSSYITIITGGSSVAKALYVPFTSVSFRYVEVRYNSSASSVSGQIFEVFIADEGYGELTGDLQIYDEERSTWRSLPNQPSELVKLKSWEGDSVQIVTIKMEDMPIPHKNISGDMFRLQDIINGKINYSLELVKVNPCE